MSRSRKRHRHRAASRRTRRRRCFENGTYVTWKGDGMDEERKEGRVLHDDGRRVSVLGSGTSLLGVVLNKRACNLHESKWRRSVKVGDIVEVSVLDQEWHPSLVRAVQHPGPRAVLVVEPVFLGYTISVPLHSFKVRSPQIEHCELQSLLDMGLAFDDFNKLAANHPEYHPFGSLKSPGAVQPTMRCYYQDGATSPCWVVQAPCTLPDRLHLIRDLTGVLRFCLDCSLLPPSMNSVASANTQKAKLGSVTISLWKPPESSETDRHVFSRALVDTLGNHLRHGDDRLAAKLLDTHRDPLLALCAFDEKKESLATALCAAAHYPYGANRVTGTVWQHGYGGREYFATADLETMHESLKRFMTGHRVHNLNMQELIQLDVRVNMWRMYKMWFGRAHDIRLALERVHPVEVSLSPDSLQRNSEIKFDVHVNYCGETLYDSRTGSSQLHRVDSEILEYFTKYALGAQPTSDPALDERVPADACPGWTDLLEESFESMVKRVCARKDSVVDAVLHRERLPCAKLQYCLSRKIECEDGRTLFWNACEGVVEKLIVDSAVDEDPEVLSVLTHPPPTERQGGVLVHDNATDKMNCVVDILKTERRRPGPADRGATIIYTAPTLLYEWHRRLTGAGIDAYVFHGSDRRNSRVTAAMNREDVIIASLSSLQSREDASHLTHSDVPEWRAFVDEFDASHVALAKGLIANPSRSVWLLCRRCDLKTLALALPLLGVRPFCFRSGWNELSALQSDFTQRRHISQLFEHRHSQQGARNALLHLCRTMVLCQTPSAPTALVLGRANHAYPSAYTEKHADVLEKFGRKILRDLRKHSLALRSSSFITNMVKRITMLCWGVMPPFNLLADRIGFGRYTTDAAQHLRAMRSVAQTQKSVQQESQKEARSLVHSLRDKKAVDAHCPICFENLSEAESGESATATAPAALSSTVVVGQCGHAVCGECADSIMRTTAENLASGANDYGPTAPVNSACCPICRHTWSEPAKRPLMLSTDPSTELRDVVGAVFRTSDCPQAQDLVEGNPMVESLKHVCDLLAPNADLAHESGSTNIVVVCRSQELVSHLHDVVQRSSFTKNLNHKAYKISRSTTPKARGKALAEFAKDVPSVQLKILFLTASLVRGMVFHRTRNYVVVEDLKAKEAEDLKYAMHASLLTFPLEQRHTPVTAHTIVAPLCPGKDCLRGITRIAPTVMIPPTRKGCIPTRPSAQKLDDEYISRIHAFFGWPPRKLSRGHISAAVIPQPLPVDAAIRLFDARLDALLALGSALDGNSEDSNIAPQADPNSLRLLLENQPTTIVIPQNDNGNDSASRSVHI